MQKIPALPGSMVYIIMARYFGESFDDLNSSKNFPYDDRDVDTVYLSLLCGRVMCLHSSVCVYAQTNVRVVQNTLLSILLLQNQIQNTIIISCLFTELIAHL